MNLRWGGAKRDEGSWRPEISVIALLLAAIALVLVATPWGIGVGYDSTFYLSSAGGLVDGHGLGRLVAGGDWIPLTHFPPLYPLLLAAGSAVTGAAPVVVARAVNALLLGLNVVMAAVIALRWSGSRLAGAAAGATFLLSPVLLERHLWAMSEPLYFTLLLAVLGSLPAVIRSEAEWPVAGLGLLAGLAMLTRYVGLSLIGCGALSILLLDKARWRQRLVRTGAFLLASAVPVAGWLIRNRLIQGGLTNRTLAFHLLTREKVAEAARAVASWTIGPVLPWKLAAVVSGVLLVVLSGAALWVVFRRLRHTESGESSVGLPATVLLLHGLAYAGALLFSLTFFDASTRLDNRILSPLYITILLLTAISLPPWLAQQGRTARVFAAGLLLAIGLSYVWTSAKLVQQGRAEGLGFQSRGWRTSEGVAYAKDLEPSRPVYSNEAIPLRFLLDRPVYAAPERLDPVLAQVRSDYKQQLSTMRDRLVDVDGVLLLFHPDSLRVEMPSKAELTDGLVQVGQLNDSEIFGPTD